MSKKMNIGIIGCGTIGKFVLDAVLSGKVEQAEVGLILVRSSRSKGVEAARNHGIPVTTEWEDLLKHNLDVVVETASHDALSAYGPHVLEAGIDLITLSIGALVDSELLRRLTAAAESGGCVFQAPSGGIGGLDALQTALVAGIDRVTMTTRKAPEAWTDIPYVERMGVDLDSMTEETLLFEGPAAACVREFPKNINIAAALSLAGIGFDRTIIRIIADPQVRYNTHEIVCEGEAGRFTMKLENVPVPENPRTTYMACLSAVAALNRIRSHYRIGT